VAERVGRASEAEDWRKRSADTVRRLLEHSFRDGQFVSLVSGTHKRSDGGDSLLNYIPIVLGRRLPDEVKDALVAGLADEGRFLTRWGLATESLRSAEFLPEGYWRGPIWPPAMLLIVDGLADAGERELAADLARRFCDLCAHAGMGECFNALTGECHTDPAYTWAASAYRLLSAQIG
jgi:glycogen debranching enzyme